MIYYSHSAIFIKICYIYSFTLCTLQEPGDRYNRHRNGKIERGSDG